MPIEDIDRAFSAMAGLVLELFSRQIAILGLLRSRLPLDDVAIQEALSSAREHLARIPIVSTLRSQTSAQRLEELEKTLRTIQYVHLKKDLKKDLT